MCDMTCNSRSGVPGYIIVSGLCPGGAVDGSG